MKKLLLSMFALALFVSASYGQSGSVKGTVNDADGNPLVGVTVQVENTNQAVVTGLSGEYTLPNVPTNAVLVYSYIGMESVSMPSNSKSVIDITMQDDATNLDEIIVIGYGTTTKRKAVGAVSSVNADDIDSPAFANVASALQGQVPGLIIESSGGGVNNLPSVSIRGGDTPLYVIDGVVSSETVFSMLNSEDIASMSFLKDAAATAVYGSRASNGIVLVQTKKGTKGDLSISYSGSIMVSEPTMMVDRLSSLEYMEQANVVYERESGTPQYTQEQMDLIGESYLYPDNDWIDMIYKDYSVQHRHNISLSGGGESSTYYVSLGNYQNSGLLENDLETLDRTNFRSNVTSTVDKIGLTVNTSVSGSVQSTRVPSYANYSSVLYGASPLDIAYNPDGTIAYTDSNPLIYFSEESYNKQKKKNMEGRLDLTWEPTFVDGLSFGAMGAYSSYNYFNRNWAAYPEWYEWDADTETSYSVGMFKQPSLTETTGYTDNVDFEARIAYLRTFGKHTIDALALYSQRTSYTEYLQAYRQEYETSALDQMSAGPIEGMDTDGYSSESANAGLVFRAKYDYDSKYIFEFSGRYDGNDNFVEGQKWGFFPSVSGVWIMSDEKFMQGLDRRNIINFLKLRASYGQTGLVSSKDINGNDTRYAYMSVYETGSLFYDGSGYINTTEEGSLVDPDNLTWYTTTSTNIGFDAAFLNSRLSFSADFFYYETVGYLGSPKDVYETTLGTDLPMVTSDSEYRRQGVEFNVRYKDTYGDWRFEIGANASYYNTLWAKMEHESLVDLMNPYTRVSQKLNTFGTAVISNGMYQNTDEILSTARYTESTILQPGDVMYVDANGDGQIDSNDERDLGMPYSPLFNYGFDFTVGYKNISVRALFQGTGDRLTFLGSTVYKCTLADGLTTYQSDRWSEDNTDARFPIYTTSQTYNGSNNSHVSSLYFENAKYFRLKNLEITYDLKKSVLKNIPFVKGLSLTASGTNLFTISPIFDLMDPEAIRFDAEDMESGTTNSIPASGSPLSKTYPLGVNVKF